MANTNTVFGARYFMNPWGGSTAGKLTPYVVDVGDAVAMFLGDFVKLTGTAEYSAQPELGYLTTIAQAAAGDAIVGVVEGFGVDPNNLSKIYNPAYTSRIAWVRNDPDAWFIIQSNGTFALADVGQCADITVGSGSTFTGISGMQLDHGAMGSDSHQLKIIGVAPDSAIGTYTKVIVMINEHAYRLTTGA